MKYQTGDSIYVRKKSLVTLHGIQIPGPTVEGVVVNTGWQIIVQTKEHSGWLFFESNTNESSDGWEIVDMFEENLQKILEE